MRRIAVRYLVCSLAMPALAGAQDSVKPLRFADNGPRFYSVTRAHGERVDVRHAAVVARTITLDLRNATIPDALTAIGAQVGLRFGWASGVLPASARISLKAEGITVAAALTQVLQNDDVDVELSPSGLAWVVRRQAPVREAMQQSGTLVGRVTDKGSGEPLRQTMVMLDGGRSRAITSDSGRYRLANVTPGTHSVTVRHLGYVQDSRQVDVRPGSEVVVDFALEKSPSQLDQVVVTGTVTPTALRALPTPVSVISDSDIALQRPRTLQELLQQAVPTAVTWDSPAYPSQTTLSVRGATTLSCCYGQMKVFIDGVEAATPGDTPVDPNSIARIEVIRGPQAAAIYGSDAIGGVVQILTKRGDPTLTRPQVEGQAAFGLVQSPYVGYKGVLRQTYAASIHGGAPDVSYNFGAGYTRTPDWVMPVSAQSHPSVYGGMHLTRGVVTADLTGRYYVQDSPQIFAPDLFGSGFVYYSKPLYESSQSQNQAVGARISLASTPWWTNTIIVGLDRFTNEQTQTQPRLTTPTDTLLSVAYSTQTKTSIGYNTSVHGALGSGVSGSLTAGFDHYSHPTTDWSTSGALTTTGSIQTDPSQPVSADRTSTNNTGYFAQVQVGVHDVLFLTGGVRAERNTNFGDSLGTPVSPQAGISYVQQVGEATLKLRGSWGRAIRAPLPGQKLPTPSPFSVNLANPALGPERQQGGDAGVDAVFGSRGSLSVTYYDQTADDLIQQVLVQSVPALTYQYQNVARVKNTGLEVEGTLNIGPAQLKGQYGYVRSRVKQLAPNYTGDLQVGDPSLFTPKHTAGASVAVFPLQGTTITAGLTYMGSYTAYDDLALLRCFGGTGACRSGPGFRNYFLAYPSFVKVKARVSQQITPMVSGFVWIDNLTKNETPELSNSLPVIGRVTTVGLQFHY